VVGIVEGRVVLGMRLIDQLDECTELESTRDIDLFSLIPITLVRMLGILAMTFSRNYNSLHYQCCVTLHPTSLAVPAEKLWGLDQGNAAKVVLRYCTDVASCHALFADRSREGPEHAIRPAGSSRWGMVANACQQSRTAGHRPERYMSYLASDNRTAGPRAERHADCTSFDRLEVHNAR
jgi:hypothetical protein